MVIAYSMLLDIFYNKTMSELGDILKKELTSNESYYADYITFSESESGNKSFTTKTCQLSAEIDRLLTNGVYNTNSVDLVIPALCNSLNMTLIILQRNSENQLIEILHTFQRSDFSSSKYIVYLLRVLLPSGTQHYDGLVR